MAESLRVLLVEDTPDDAELVLHALRKAGFEPQHERVETGEAMRAALDRDAWDIVISDHRLPQFSSVAALELLKLTGKDLPFIIVSGTIGEDTAVEVMRAGASDYVMKDKLARLGPVVHRELREAMSRRERREAERALRETEEVFRTLSVCSPLGIFMTDAAGQFRYVNPHYRTLHGLTLMQSLNDGWLMATHPDDRARVREAWAAFVQGEGKEALTIESRIQHGAGEERWVQMRAFPMRAEDKALTGFVGTIEDITDRKRAEQQLRNSEQRFRDLFEHSPDAVFVESADGRLLDVNPAACRLHGFSRDELLGKTVTELVPPDKRAEVSRNFGKWFDGGQAFYEGFAWTVDERTVPVELRGVRIEYQGRPAILLHVRDLTERRQLEAQLLQAQKMEAVGRLAGGVAHDFNNILTAITGYSELSLRRLKPDDPLHHNLEQVRRASDRAAALTRQLLAFSRKQTLQPIVFDLNIVVDDAQKMLRRLIGEDIELITKLAPNIRHIKADPGQIEQVILNLAVNARDAMRDGGRLEIETSNLDEPGQSSNVSLTVTDTGCGMTPEVMAHIFEPFFTTKPAGEGTGLGLATCYGIVAQSGGEIRVESQPGKGTTFRVYLPVVDEPLSNSAEGIAAQSVQGGDETILLVEDDPNVRAIAVMALQQYGYTIWEANDGREALERVRQPDAENISLVVTDVVMPNLSGRELADQLREELPGAKVLFTSGYTDDAISHHGILEPGIHYLPKPYTPAKLAGKVREVLDGKSG